MPISTGDSIPAATLRRLSADGMEEVSTTAFFGNRKVVLFSVPGAFTPTCSVQHLPGFVQNADAIKAKGVDEIVCIAVNDAFVMDAWGKSQNTGDSVTLLADGNGEFTQALDLGLDGTGFGLGQRGQRFAMVVENGTVAHLAVEEPGAFEVSSAERILAVL
ncbi:MAG: peroxiredoxin [Rhodospirillales bacterium]|nr:peroxiredoxin [Rhodospirillales bacterium]MDE0712405.1 peroxiredoxin [Rhodospirillales bacterium]